MSRNLPGSRVDRDWFDGTIPENARIDDTAFIETAFSFRLAKSSRADAITIGRGAAAYLSTMFDLGEDASVTIGEYALVTGVCFISDASIEVGDDSMLSWNVVLMDTYRFSLDPACRRAELQALARRPDRRPRTDPSARAIRIESNVWIGFDVVVMPGVTIGKGSVVGAKSVVFDDVKPYTVVAGNPARIVRHLEPLTEPAGNG
jgi:acetyltransferase-like isoleucine patch superfamily enzyme